MYSLFMRQRPTIVHYHIPRALSGFEAILAGYLARVRGRIRTDHNPVVHPPTQLQLLRLRIADRMVHRIVLVSTDNQKNHLDVCGRPVQKCLVIPNGIDARTVSHDQSPVHRTSLRDRLGLPVGVPVAVMVAVLGERKGALDYIKAAHVASKIHAALHFAVVGDGEMMSTMRRMATEFRIGDRVHFLGRRADVRNILPAFDMFVLPSHYEGLAITMLEALAAGLPMVTTRVDGVSDVLPREQGALFVDKYDIDGLGAAMAQLAGDPELRRQLAAISAERVLSGFTADIAYERYRTLYSQLCTIN
jgi:glycosyltransferase involved in cell wall biosynthesis